MNTRIVTLMLAALPTLLCCPASAAVPAGVARAFVSGGGSDANTTVNCSLTQPCRTFQNAMTVLNDGGEVIALDSAGYGTVTITKSVSLIAPAGIFAGLTPGSGGTGVAINTPGVTVNLRGITINSAGGGAGAYYGINMTAGAKLNLDRVTINNFVGSFAMVVQTAAIVTANDIMIINSGIGMKFGGGATATVTNTRIQGIDYEGIMIGGGSSGTTLVSVSDTSVTGSNASYTNCFENGATAGTIGRLVLNRVTANSCYRGVAFIPNSAGVNMISVSNSQMVGNGYGFDNERTSSYGIFRSTGNNQIDGSLYADTLGTISVGGMY